MKKILTNLKVIVAFALVATLMTGCSTEVNDEVSDNGVVYDVNESADVVIVGGGGTGMSAALTAIENGAESVVIIEKLTVLGGFMRMKTGQFSAPDTTIQHEQGLMEDSAERYEEEILKFANLNGGHPIEYLVHSYATNASAAWEWVYEMGVKEYPFKTDEDGNKAIINPGHMPYDYNRVYVPLAKEDSTVVNPIIEVFEKEIVANTNIKVFTEVEGKQLTTNENGQVNGVIAKGKDGTTYKFNANNGVIMSTGGYAANPNLFELYSTDLNNLISAALSANDGYGLYMMQELGAGITEEAMTWIETYPKGLINEGSTTAGVNGSTGTYYTGGILVNINGERFINECAWEDEVRNEALKEQPDSYMYEVFTDEIFEATKGTLRGAYDSFKEGGTYYNRLIQADSLEELAEKLEIPVDNFVSTVNTYNESVDSGVTDEFGREFTAKTGENRVEVKNKIEGSKYYALKIQPIVLSSRGGIMVNEFNQVITSDSEVIPGLYAGGEVVGQMWGKTIAPGVGMNGCVTWGRITGKNVMTLPMNEKYEVKVAPNIFDENLFVFDDAEHVGIDYKNLNDGTYTGSSQGMNGLVEVEVVVIDSKLSDIQIIKHSETENIADAAIKEIPQNIILNQSTNVDSISNATITSEAIKKAVEDALK